MAIDRNLLRQTYRAHRDALPPEDRRTKSLQICEHLLRHPLLQGARRVALFASIGSEVDTSHALASLRAAGVACALPRVVQRHGPLEFAWAAEGAQLQAGALGVLEPAGPPVPLASLDVVLVPGLVFDRQLHRLGYGKGYYDRTLAAYTGRTVGLAFALQVVEQLPVQAHDVPLHALATEAGMQGRRGL